MGRPNRPARYQKLRLDRGKAALIEQSPGGWWHVTVTGTQHHIETLLEQLNERTD